jgi:hypothetical protein
VALVRWRWREVTYSGRVLSWWKLSDKWWDAAKDGLWVLARIQG